MSVKFDKFVAALRALCTEHEVMIEVGYDNWYVWDAQTEGPFVGNAFHQDITPIDRTGENG